MRGRDRRERCRLLAETRQSCPRRTTFQLFVAKGLGRILLLTPFPRALRGSTRVDADQSRACPDVIADEDGDQARRRCATWRREEAVDGEDREHSNGALAPVGGKDRCTRSSRRRCVPATSIKAGRKRAPRRREVPQRPVRKRAPGRVQIVQQQCERASPTRRRRPSKRRRHVRASARKAAGNLPSRMECRAGDRQNCGENVHGGNLAGCRRRSSTWLLLRAMTGQRR